MKFYVSCPICGYKLLKCESGSDVDIICPRCSKLIQITVTDKGICAIPTEAPNKEKDKIK